MLHSETAHRPKWRRAISGAVLFTAGLFILLVALGYPGGQLTQMGPGFMPRFVGGLICVMALVIIYTDVTEIDPPSPTALHWRGLIYVSASIVSFAPLVDPAGLVPSMFVAVLVSMLASEKIRPVGMLVYAVAVTLAGWLLFVLVLELPIPVFGR